MEADIARTPESRILLVDDDEMVRETFKAVLKIHDFHVTTAGSVSQAIHLIDTETPICTCPAQQMASR
jgi:DNA-binding response OmpR family regulator